MTDQSNDQTVPPIDAPVGDMRTRCWFDQFLPPFMREWARLGRWDRPIGIWLLYWPCSWGLMLAPHFRHLSYQQQFYWLGLFLLGAFLMRGAGCTINDLWDRKLDAQVARTAQRPLAAGRISVASALVFLALQCAGGLWVLWHLPPLAQIIALLYVPLIILYPLMKRITMWPQAFLAIVFSAGVLIGWATTESPISWVTVLLYITSMAWVLAYDTIYAHMDKRDDAMVGIQSTVIGLGERAVDLIIVCLWFFCVAWGTVGMASHFTVLAWITTIIALFFQLVRSGVWNPDDDAKTLQYFQSQRWFGGMLALSCWYTVLQHMPSPG